MVRILKGECVGKPLGAVKKKKRGRRNVRWRRDLQKRFSSPPVEVTLGSWEN